MNALRAGAQKAVLALGSHPEFVEADGRLRRTSCTNRVRRKNTGTLQP